MNWVKSCLKISAMAVLTAAILGMVTLTAIPKAGADDAEAQAKVLKQVERELRQLRADRARDHKVIQKLQQELDQVRTQDNDIRTSNQQLQTTTQKLQTSNQQLQTKTDTEAQAASGSGDTRTVAAADCPGARRLLGRAFIHPHRRCGGKFRV